MLGDYGKEINSRDNWSPLPAQTSVWVILVKYIEEIVISWDEHGGSKADQGKTV